MSGYSQPIFLEGSFLQQISHFSQKLFNVTVQFLKASSYQTIDYTLFKGFFKTLLIHHILHSACKNKSLLLIPLKVKNLLSLCLYCHTWESPRGCWSPWSHAYSAAVPLQSFCTMPVLIQEPEKRNRFCQPLLKQMFYFCLPQC